jgi:hypothetical protein
MLVTVPIDQKCTFSQKSVIFSASTLYKGYLALSASSAKVSASSAKNEKVSASSPENRKS